MDQVYVCDLWDDLRSAQIFTTPSLRSWSITMSAMLLWRVSYNPPPKILLKKFWWSGGEQKQKRRRPMEYWRVWWWVCLIKANLRLASWRKSIQESSAANEYKHSFHSASSAPVIRPAVDNPTHSKLVLCTRFPFSNTPPQWEQKASVSIFLFSTFRLSCAVQRNQQRQKNSASKREKSACWKVESFFWNFYWVLSFLFCSAALLCIYPQRENVT